MEEFESATRDLVPYGATVPTVVSGFADAAEELEAEVLSLTSEDKYVDAFNLVDEGVSVGVMFVRSSLLYTVHCIALAKLLWDNMDVSQQEAYGPNFYVYVSKRFEVSQSPSTVDNYAYVGRSWLVRSTQIAIPEAVSLYSLDDDLTPMPVLNSKGEPYKVLGDPWKVNYAKLLAARAKAEKDQMSEVDWGLLFNSKVSQGKLLDYWRGSKQENNSSALTFTLVSGMLCISDGVDAAPLAEMLSLAEIEANPLAKQGWLRLQVVLGIGREDDF